MSLTKQEAGTLMLGSLLVVFGLTVLGAKAAYQSKEPVACPIAPNCPQDEFQGYPVAINAAVAAPTKTERQNGGIIRQVTAYNSVPWQTDDTPCLAADGTDICERHRAGERICASNAFPFGTRLALHGDEKTITCVVADRMNSRYPNRVDLFMDQDIEAAQSFGLQSLYVERQ